MVGKGHYKTLGLLRATKIANKYVMSRLDVGHWQLTTEIETEIWKLKMVEPELLD